MKKIAIAFLTLFLICAPALADVLFDLPAGEYEVIALAGGKETAYSHVQIFEAGKLVAKHFIGERFTLSAGQVVSEVSAAVQRVDDKAQRMKDALGLPSSSITERRDLVEFCELYIKRMLQNSFEEVYISGASRLFNTIDTETEYYVTTAGASLRIDKETFAINSATLQLITIKGDEYTEYIDRCAGAISALEFDCIDEDIASLHSSSDLFPDAQTVWDQSKQIVNSIANMINTGTDSFWNKFWSGQPIPAYQGNYSYSICYYEPEDTDMAIVFIAAEAR